MLFENADKSDFVMFVCSLKIIVLLLHQLSLVSAHSSGLLKGEQDTSVTILNQSPLRPEVHKRRCGYELELHKTGVYTITKCL